MKMQLCCVLFLQAIMVTDVVADCASPLGMTDHRISDDQITASTWLYFKKPPNPHYRPYLARLHDDSSSGAWCSEDIYAYKNQHIEVDLLVNTKITALGTQGRFGSREHVERYQIEYMRENDKYRKYKENNGWVIFQGNNDSTTEVRNTFSHPIIARKLRLYPLGDEFTIYCLRMELYGCPWENAAASLRQYRAPLGGERRGLSMKDLTYDGEISFGGNYVSGGLGKLADEVYGTANLLSLVGSPWLAYDGNSPLMEFAFNEKRLFQRVLIHVNNKGGDIQIFDSVDVSISSDGMNFTLVKTFRPSEQQVESADAFAVFIDLSDVVAQFVQLLFNRRSVWLLISEVKFFTESYPPLRPFATFAPPESEKTKLSYPAIWNKPATDDPTSLDKQASLASTGATKGLSFPIILTITLLGFLITAVVVVLIYKKHRRSKSARREPGRARLPLSSTDYAQNKQSMALLYDERLVSARNGLYIQQNGYPTKVVIT